MNDLLSFKSVRCKIIVRRRVLRDMFKTKDEKKDFRLPEKLFEQLGWREVSSSGGHTRRVGAERGRMEAERGRMEAERERREAERGEWKPKEGEWKPKEEEWKPKEEENRSKLPAQHAE